MPLSGVQTSAGTLKIPDATGHCKGPAKSRVSSVHQGLPAQATENGTATHIYIYVQVIRTWSGTPPNLKDAMQCLSLKRITINNNANLSSELWQWRYAASTVTLRLVAVPVCRHNVAHACERHAAPFRISTLGIAFIYSSHIFM